jgi:secretion/DNA translocation related CpaE-like protein
VFRVALAVGAVDVVELPLAESWVVELLTDAVDTRGVAAIRPHAHTVGVVSGSGGSGATTFACALALTAARRRQAMLVDLDPLGPGVDRVVGLDSPSGVRWDALAYSRGRLGSRSLRAALPDKDGLAVLTWDVGSPVDLDAATVREVLSAARRGNDVVVVDLPRGVDDVSAEVFSRCDRVLVVATASVAGVASAGKVAAVLRPLNQNLGVVVRVGGPAVPADDVAATLGLPLVAEVPHQRRLAEHVDLGLGPVHGRRSRLARAADLVLAGQEAA